MTSFLTLALSRQSKMSAISNFIVISLFLNELRSNLVWEEKIKRKEIWKQIYSSKPNFLYYFLQKFLVVFSQTPVRNRVTMATAYVPGDQKVYQMMCNRLTIKVTKFQQSSANRFWAVAKNCLGANLPLPPPYKLGLNGMMMSSI